MKENNISCYNFGRILQNYSLLRNEQEDEAKEKKPYLSLPTSIKKRKYLTRDFLPPTKHKKIPYPMHIDDYEILNDLFNILLGIDGKYIYSVNVPRSNVRKFCVDKSVPRTYRKKVKPFIALASFYSIIIRFTEQRNNFECGKINQALSAELRSEIKNYITLVSKLDVKHACKEVSFHTMKYMLEPMLKRFAVLSKIVTYLNRDSENGGVDKSRGSNVLTDLYQQCINYQGDIIGEEIAKSLISKTCRPYFNMLQNWLFRGTIQDALSEFAIENSTSWKENTFAIGNVLENQSNLRNCYKIIHANIPNFLKGLEDHILAVGKYVDVLNKCGIKIFNTAPAIDFNLDKEYYKTIIDNAYNEAANTLDKYIKSDINLSAYFDLLKEFVLLNRSDIFIFLTKYSTEFQKPLKNININHLNEMLEKEHPDISIRLIPYTLEKQIETYRCCSSKTHILIKEDFSITGWEAFSLNLKTQYPLTIIFDSGLIVYQIIHRIIFECRYVEHVLYDTWKESNKYKLPVTELKNQNYQYPFFATSDDSINFALISSNFAFTLRNKVLHFVRSILGFMIEEVLIKGFANISQQLKSTMDFEEFLQAHDNSIEGMLDGFFINQSLVLKPLLKIFQISKNLCKHMINNCEYEFHSASQKELLDIKNDLDMNINVFMSFIDKLREPHFKLLQRLKMAGFSTSYDTTDIYYDELDYDTISDITQEDESIYISGHE